MEVTKKRIVAMYLKRFERITPTNLGAWHVVRGLEGKTEIRKGLR